MTSSGRSGAPVRALVAHGAGDLRVDEREAGPVPAGQVAVRIRYGGICGSDLHYWRHGRVGDFWLREPLTLGHEVVGTVEAVGAGVPGPEPGTPVFVHPASTCGGCRAGRPNLCPEVRYLGSAARMPHVQGGFADLLLVPAGQVLPLPEGLDLAAAAVVEPASVALHAVRRAAGILSTGILSTGIPPAGAPSSGGSLAGARVLVVGAGPIGVLVVAAARRAGAAEIVVSDLATAALDRALAAGADTAITVGDAVDDDLDRLEADVAIESSEPMEMLILLNSKMVHNLFQ